MFYPSRIDDDFEIRQRNHSYWKDELMCGWLLTQKPLIRRRNETFSQ